LNDDCKRRWGFPQRRPNACPLTRAFGLKTRFRSHHADAHCVTGGAPMAGYDRKRTNTAATHLRVTPAGDFSADLSVFQAHLPRSL